MKRSTVVGPGGASVEDSIRTRWGRGAEAVASLCCCLRGHKHVCYVLL